MLTASLGLLVLDANTHDAQSHYPWRDFPKARRYYEVRGRSQRAQNFGDNTAPPILKLLTVIRRTKNQVAIP